MQGWYGPELALAHHQGFGDLAREAAATLLDEAAARGLPGGLVVDLGSGSGILARLLTEAGFDVVGFEISADMVRLAAEHAPAARFVHGALLDADIPPCVAVTAVGEVLNYAADARTGVDGLSAVMARARASLHPGGLLLFDVAGPGRAGPTGRREAASGTEHWEIRAVVEEDASTATLVRDITLVTGGREVRETHHLRLYRPDDVEDALAGAGYSAVRRLDRYRRFEFPPGLTGFLATA